MKSTLQPSISNQLKEIDVKKFIDDLLDRSQYIDFTITMKEREMMLEILKENPHAIQIKSKKIYQPTSRLASLDDYDYSRKRAISYIES